MRGVIILNAFLRLPSFLSLQDAYLRAAKALNIDLAPMTNADCIDLPPADFVLFYDKDVRLARRFEMAGMRVFNPSRAIEVCDDKTLTFLELESAAVPQIDTILCPKTFPGAGYGDMKFVDTIGDRLSWPLVLKEGMGSLGQQVYLCKNAEEAKQRLRAIGDKNALFQRFVSASAGRDKRLFVVGDEVIAAIERRNFHGDFRANIENGGTPRAITPTKTEISLALQAARALGLDFAGVDLLDDEMGPRVCEVNSNAHFGGLSRVTGVDPAMRILMHIRRVLCKGG